jgi:SH3-like domain-containing protein
MMRIAASLLLLLAVPAWALDFASTQRPAILYDAPSTAATKVAVVSAGYPLEKVVSTSGWTKVRGETGKLAWIEESSLSTKRTLLVTVPLTLVMEKPMEDAPVLFRVARGVTLDMLLPTEGGWVKVRHASGQEGYVQIRDVWGL